MIASPTRRAVLRASLAAAALAASGCAVPSLSPEVGSRRIGFDLWSGKPGAAFGFPLKVVSGSRVIRGPIDWTHPITGERLSVYERRNAEPGGGEKVQLFAPSSGGGALGRVFDRRPGQADRHFVGDAFFPLGVWTAGERRSWTMTEHEGGVARQRTATIRIRRLSFDDGGRRDALRYDWSLNDPAGTALFEERYVYAPGVGFVSFSNRLG